MSAHLEGGWKLVQTGALLGSDQQLVDLAALPQEVEAMLSTTAAPTTNLLRALGVLTLLRQAGRVWGQASVMETPCAPDAWPRASARAISLLHSTLEMKYGELLYEWLALAASSQRRLAEELLPALLDRTLKEPNLLPNIGPVLGERGRWLAAINPAWRPLADLLQAGEAGGEQSDVLWQTGTPAVRAYMLQAARRRNPGEGLRLVAQVWAEEPVQQRAAFLRALETGLNMGDEGLLEDALDDRSKEVRAVAAELLAGLPDSRLVQRMIARAQALLSFTAGGLLRRAGLEVTLPEACDAAMRRDGIEPKPPQGQKLGDKAWLLLQILERVPPACWARQFERTPAQLLALASQGEWKDILYAAWANAARRYGDAEWAEAIKRLMPGASGLLLVLDTPRAEALLTERLQTSPKDALSMMTAYHRQWSAELSRLTLKRLERFMRDGGDASALYQLRERFVRMALWMHPGVLEDLRQLTGLFQQAHPAWQEGLQEMLSILTLRKQMWEEFQK